MNPAAAAVYLCHYPSPCIDDEVDLQQLNETSVLANHSVWAYLFRLVVDREQRRVCDNNNVI